MCGLYSFVEGVKNAKAAGNESDSCTTSFSDDEQPSWSSKSNTNKRKRADSEEIVINPGTSKIYSHNNYKQSTNNINPFRPNLIDCAIYLFVFKCFKK